jgi:hypothetical protein
MKRDPTLQHTLAIRCAALEDCASSVIAALLGRFCGVVVVVADPSILTLPAARNLSIQKTQQSTPSQNFGVAVTDTPFLGPCRYIVRRHEFRSHAERDNSHKLRHGLHSRGR